MSSVPYRPNILIVCLCIRIKLTLTNKTVSSVSDRRRPTKGKVNYRDCDNVHIA